MEERRNGFSFAAVIRMNIITRLQKERLIEMKDVTFYQYLEVTEPK